MNFTREPIIETVITPKDGCKLVVRSSKAPAQDEYLVDALEVVTFGHASFYRSLEKPKCFLVPVSDYEVFEMRETRVVLKHATPERFKSQNHKEKERHFVEAPKETLAIKPLELIPVPEFNEVNHSESVHTDPLSVENLALETVDADAKNDKKRDRRRQRRKRPVRETKSAASPEEAAVAVKPTRVSTESMEQVSQMLASLIPPPTTLVSDLIGARYKDLIQQNSEDNSSKSKSSEDIVHEILD